MKRLEIDEKTRIITDPTLKGLNKSKVHYVPIEMPKLLTYKETGELEQLILRNAPENAEGYTISSSQEIKKGVDGEITGEYELFNVVGVQYFRKYLTGFLD